MLKKFVITVAAIASLMFMSSSFAAVEINTADQAQLDSIAGIGPATSRAILEERKKNGNYKDWADLEQRVRGIGERNSVKLSAAGLVVNGQPRSAGTASEHPGRPAKVTKPAKEIREVKADVNGSGKGVDKGGEAKH